MSDKDDHDFIAWESCGILSAQPYSYQSVPVKLYRRKVKELTTAEIDAVVNELREKSFDPKRWVDVYAVAIETIIQLRDELATLRKEQEK